MCQSGNKGYSCTNSDHREIPTVCRRSRNSRDLLLSSNAEVPAAAQELLQASFSFPVDLQVDQNRLMLICAL